jgi:hypothetical protein
MIEDVKLNLRCYAHMENIYGDIFIQMRRWYLPQLMKTCLTSCGSNNNDTQEIGGRCWKTKVWGNTKCTTDNTFEKIYMYIPSRFHFIMFVSTDW